MEEDKVDVEVEGNTLVNLADIKSTFEIRNFNSYYKDFTICETSKLKLNTDYTLFIYKELLDNHNENYKYLELGVGNTLNSIITHPTMETNDNYHSKYSFKFKKDDSNKILKIKFRFTDFKDYKYLAIRPIRRYSAPVTNEYCNANIKILFLEGDYTEFDISYFEGMKSAGELENNKLNIEVLGENLFNIDYFINMIESHYNEGNYGYEVKDSKNTIWVSNNHRNLLDKNLLSNKYKFKENTQYIIKSKVFLEGNPNNQQGLVGKIYYTDNTSQYIILGVQDEWYEYSIVTKENKTVEKMIFSYGSNNAKNWIDLDSLYIGEYKQNKTEFNYDYNVQNIELNLTEPLRALPNGVKDRIIKRNGQWLIERNCWGGIITGDEVFYDGHAGWSNTVFGVSIDYPAKKNARTLMWNSDTVMPRTVNELVFNDVKGFAIWDYNGFKAFVDVGKETKEETKSYIKDNPIKYVYELETPIYEPLNIDLLIPLYLDKTYIYNDSTVPCNMKIIVDRVVNRAVEAIDLAKSNPTIENISNARMWTNLIKESIKKDELQNEISNMDKVNDLQLEKKNITSNVDIYIKPINILSINLSTNSISFEDFSIAQDMEQSSAVKITVESSLPYNLNAYLESEIQNSEKTKTIDKSILNIKSSDETEYKAFSDLKTPILLANNQDVNGASVHKVDIKLSGNTPYEVDVYKTVIKFEAEQK